MCAAAALCLRRGIKSEVLSAAQPHAGLPVLTPAPTRGLELCCLAGSSGKKEMCRGPSLQAVVRRDEEAREFGKTQADVVLRPQSLEAGLPACRLLSEATWTPG